LRSGAGAGYDRLVRFAIALSVVLSAWLACGHHIPVLDDGWQLDEPSRVSVGNYTAFFLLTWDGARIGDASESVRRLGNGYRFERMEHISVKRAGLLVVSRTRVTIDTDLTLRASRVEIRTTSGAAETLGWAIRTDRGWKVSINDEPLKEAELVADVNGKPTLIASGTVNFHIIFRGSYALRIKDSQAATLKQFKGVENYPIQQDWQIDGRFIKADEGASIEITNVLGQISESPVFGTFEFQRNGKTHSILGIGEAESKNLWFIFADRTSGHGTYGGGRFLSSDGMPENGRLTVDFNKAYNPPCAFSPYSTCPLPPQQNRLDLMVTAGEKDFHPASG